LDDEQQEAPDSAAAEWIKRNFNLLVLVMAFGLFIVPYVTPFEGLNVFQRFSEWTLRQLEHLFKDYGYWVVFFGVLLENSMFLGLLVPGAIILILAGLSAENGSINAYYVIGLAIVATMIGDTISYMIGRLGWTKTLERAGIDKMIERVREPMHSNSTWIILGYHLAGYSRVIGPAAAGIFRIPFRKWAPLDYLGGTIWVLLFTTLGIVLGLAGVEFGDTKRMVRLLELGFLAVFAVAITLAIVRSQRGGDRSGPGGTKREHAPVIVPVDKPD
jgi:membrane protein DedA with SNARE-associated domain